MRKISKALAIAGVLAIGGASVAALAQGGPGYGPPGYGYGPMGYMHGPGGYGMMGGWGGYGMMGGWGGYGYADPAERLDAVRSELALRPDQTAAWDSYAKAVRDGAKQMQTLRGNIDFDKLRTMSWQDHWAYMGQFHDARAAVFRSIQTARGGLLAVLDDGQKSRLLASGPGNFAGNFGPGMGWGRGGYGGGYGHGPGMGPGYGMMGGWGGYR